MTVGSCRNKTQLHAQTVQSARQLANSRCSSNFREFIYVKVVQQLEFRENLLLHTVLKDGNNFLPLMYIILDRSL